MKKFTSKTQQIGEIGENLACKKLLKLGFHILERNYTKQGGEIDIVAKKGKKIHFIEVKSVSRENLDFVSPETSLGYRPEENMHPGKIRRFVKTVEYYIMEKNIPENIEYQVDLALAYIDITRRAGKVVLMEKII